MSSATNKKGHVDDRNRSHLSLNYLDHLTLAGTPTRDQSHNPEPCLTARVHPTWGVLAPAEALTRCLKAPGRLTGLLFLFPGGPPGAVCLCNCLAHLTLAGTPTRDQTHNPEPCLTARVRPTWGVLAPAEALTRAFQPWQ